MNDAEFFAKARGKKTFKQHQQEHLLKATIIPASDLAKRKQDEEERTQAFTRAALDEEFVNRTEKSVFPDCLNPTGQRLGVITREPFEEQP